MKEHRRLSGDREEIADQRKSWERQGSEEDKGRN